MDRNEKILLLECILKDVRCNWSDYLDSRIDMALQLSKELDFQEHIKTIEEFKSDMNNIWLDGRCFRKSFERGGYEGLKALHGLSVEDERSEEFLNIFNDLITCPSMIG